MQTETEWGMSEKEENWIVEIGLLFEKLLEKDKDKEKLIHNAFHTIWGGTRQDCSWLQLLFKYLTLGEEGMQDPISTIHGQQTQDSGSNATLSNKLISNQTLTELIESQIKVALMSGTLFREKFVAELKDVAPADDAILKTRI